MADWIGGFRHYVIQQLFDNCWPHHLVCLKSIEQQLAAKFAGSLGWIQPSRAFHCLSKAGLWSIGLHQTEAQLHQALGNVIPSNNANITHRQ